MQITLNIDGKEKTYTNDFVKARIFKNALKLNKEMKSIKEISEELFDKLVEFVVVAFDRQFTVDEVWDGLAVADLQSEAMRIFNEVLSLGGLQIESDEGNEPGK
ncbi:hypothetical protein A8F94_17465 [Bacillus sp. FJAT-27225]|uniref:phage tail assembly chaperone G n=1 Tax=Bacillus sp. FJAT-27225 TaxID=1743144 RepID=UPI00080C225C|nr:hypothetical protein [Bacillus sp. FJAT-27225]OCA84485.1 hypothetical protein A8F94_17465 [Bacillus sp. FJAT-27225]